MQWILTLRDGLVKVSLMITDSSQFCLFHQLRLNNFSIGTENCKAKKMAKVESFVFLSQAVSRNSFGVHFPPWQGFAF